jgi:hypothetical protein
MTVGSGLLVSRRRQQRHMADYIRRQHLHGHVADHVHKDMWHTMSAEHDSKRHVADHVNKYTWNNQMMTGVKRKLAHSMSTSDVIKLRHSGRIALGVSPPRNVKNPEVLKDEGPKSLSSVDIRYIES